MDTALETTPAAKRDFIRKVVIHATGELLEALYLAALEISLPVKPKTQAELKELCRRAAILAGKAEPAQFGRVLCPVCNEEKRRTVLIDHLRRTHVGKILAMPAEAFQ